MVTQVRHRIRNLALPLAVAVLVLAGASAALAQSELGGKIRAGDQLVVAADETVEGDLYATAGQVRVDGTIDGDLIVASGTVTITGQVTGDLMVAGGTIDVSGEMIGDARVAAGQLSLSGSIGEDLFVTSGQTTVTSSGEIGEDLVFGSGRVTMDGAVTGDVLGAAGMYERQGTVDGSENVTVDADEEAAPTAADRLVNALQRLISIFLVAALVLWLARRWIVEPAETVRRRPLASLGIGLVSLIGFGVLVFLVILVAVLVSFLLALVGLGGLAGAIVFGSIVVAIVLVFLFYVAAVFGAPTWVAVALGRLAIPSDSPGTRWTALVFGLVVVVGLSAIPIVGGWVGFIVAVVGLGALVLARWPRRSMKAYTELGEA